ncbi:MAG: protein kinase [Myxococcales bacterium]|nr:protein kinase [Myxococcales bacterium]
MAAPPGGTVLAGKYRLERPLNEGGMGSVWVARHLELDVEVAVKLISWVQALKPVMVERFKREARAAAQIRSPHVVQILDYGVHDGVPYMAMELLAGEDLSEHLEARGRITPKRILEIIRPVCKVLGLAHQAGIVHRDIKPANIFLAQVGDDEVVKVLDFGIAKEINRDAQHTTGTGLVGSPLYMSPEQIRGSDVDAQSDLWSLGVVLYEALTGAAPFESGALGVLFQLVSTTDAPAPSTKVPELAALDGFFQKALARDKTKRFTTVKDFLAAFEDAVGRAPEVVVPSIKPAPRSAVGSGTEALAPTADISSLSGGAQRSPSPALSGVGTLDLPSSADLPRPEAAKSKRSPALIGAVVGVVALGSVAAAYSALGPGGATGSQSLASAEAASREPAPASSDGHGLSVVALSATAAASMAPAAASATPSASAAAQPSVAVAPAPAPPPGGGGGKKPPTPSETAKPASTQPPTTDPIWGVPVSQPKR